MQARNLFADLDLPTGIRDELVEVLAEGQGALQIERIVSRGHASPEGFWYDQQAAEFVVLLKGSALLRFEDQEDPLALEPGDWVEIAAHRRHRVEETSREEPTVWLAVHWA